MVKYYEGWVYHEESYMFRFYPHKVSRDRRGEFSAWVNDTRFKVYDNYLTISGTEQFLSQWFGNRRNPTQDELTLFELEFGVDVSYPLSQLFS